MRDKRDMPFIYLCLKIMLVTIPFAIFLFIPGCFNWWLGVIYLVVNMVLFLGPFTLMLHNTCHRKLFKKEYNFLNSIIPWIIGPFYGESPQTYFHHHVTMHHVENNIPPDVSSTMTYHRDKLGSFLRYFGRFLFYGIVDLLNYFKTKKQSKFLIKVLIGELFFFALCVALSFLNWKATLIVFILPFFIARLTLMMGNWAQHAFIDMNDPGNSFRNSITCINTVYNKKCFNDGYHIGHHLRAGLHWTEMPADFLKNIKQYADEKAVIFEGLDYMQIWFFLMSKNYKKLANRFVDVGNKYPNEEAICEFLKSRTRNSI